MNEGRWTQVGIVSWGKSGYFEALFLSPIKFHLPIVKASDAVKVNTLESTLA